LLETRGLTKRFGGLVAVDGLALSLRRGEIRGVIGPNGSGKTTTVNLLSGLYRADTGEIWLQGERVDRLRPHEITARGVARTFQVPKLFGNMTVLENVLVPALAALARRADRAMPEILERAHRLLEFVTLERLCDAPARQLSGGQGMLAQIAAGYVEGIDILADIALRVEPGSITGIIGPNGAGKSTLLKTIFGFLHPRRGRILHGGREIQALASYAIKRLGISYVPQGQN